MKQKGLAPLVIIILIAFALGGYLLYQKQFKPNVISQPSPTPATSDETANWKTYTNIKYGFSIKYPQDWTVEETSSSISWKSVDYKLSMNGNITSGQNIVLLVDQNPTQKSLENWWGNTNTDYIVSNKVPFKIDGHDSIEYNLSAPGGVIYGALVNNSDKVFRFEAFATEDKTSNAIKILKQILSTFKFTQ